MLRDRVDAVRRFNRFYTRQIGLLGKGYLDSPFTLAEVRVLYELAHRDAPTAAEIAKALGLDAGYLSRMLLSFRKRGYLARKASRKDARQSHLSLTKKGQVAFGVLEAKSEAGVSEMIERLSVPDQSRLTVAMGTIESLLGERAEPKTPYLLRTHQPGDMGWVIHRHGVLYAQEYGWDERFEALVARIAAEFIQNVRCEARAMLDRGERWRHGGLGVPGEEIESRGKVAAAAGGTVGARARDRRAVGRRMRPLRAAGGISQDHAVDAIDFGRGAGHLSQDRVSRGEARAASELWIQADGRDLGIDALRRSDYCTTQYPSRVLTLSSGRPFTATRMV